MGQREDNPKYPGIEGVWFKVIDKDGNALDLTPYSPQPVQMQNGEPSQIVVDDNDVHLGWFPTSVIKAPPSTVQELKFTILDFFIFGPHTKLKSDDYEVSVDGSGSPSDNTTTVDYAAVGLTRNDPLVFTEKSDDKTGNKGDDGTANDDGNNDKDKDKGDDGTANDDGSNDKDKVDGGTANDDGSNDKDKDDGTANDNSNTDNDKPDDGAANDDGNGSTNNDDDNGTNDGNNDNSSTNNDDNGTNDNGTEDDNNNTSTNQGTSDDEDNANKDSDPEEASNSDNDNDSDNGRGGKRKSKSKSKRDYHPRRPGVKGFWVSVIDKYGNTLDLSSSFKYWDSSPSSAHGTDVAWLPIHGRYTAHALKRRVLKKLGKLKKMKDWGVYDEEGDSVAYDDSSRSEYVDLDNYGLRKKKPIAVKESPDDDSGSDDGSGKGSSDSGSSGSGSSSDDEMPPPDITDTSSQGQNSSSADPYRLFTKRIQCMSNADWSRYEGSIQNTYQGEILWTDGNCSYGVANMMAYLAVRRVPNTPTGNVVAVGRAANEPAYFVYLG